MRVLKFLPIALLISTISIAQDPVAILKAAADTITKIQSISYNNYLKSQYEQVTADVTIKRESNSGLFEGSAIKISGIAIGEEGSKQISFAYDGEYLDFFDLKTNQLTRIDNPTYPKLSRTGMMGYSMIALAPYWQEKPFVRILSQLKDAKLLEDTTIFDVECYKIQVYIESESPLSGKFVSSPVWYIGKKKKLINGFRSAYESHFLKIRSVNQELEKNFFSLSSTAPKIISGLEPIGDGLLPVGIKAPLWTLPGKENEISLELLRGNVVLLDFWGTWCVPCIKAMPDIQAIHDHFKGKQVVIIGVSVETEKAADPIAFVKRKGFSYPIALNGHSITKAYQVNVFPSVYIIDQNGNIVHAEHSGGRENFKEDIILKIEKLLK